MGYCRCCGDKVRLTVSKGTISYCRCCDDKVRLTVSKGTMWDTADAVMARLDSL